MPVLPPPGYAPLPPFTNGHVQSMFPVLFRKVDWAPAQTERIDTPDGDFLDIDNHPSRLGDSRRLAVVGHGIEGNSRRKYVLGMARALCLAGWDVCAWNMRGCSPTPNRLLRFYHSGETGDLHTVLTHCLGRKEYDRAVLVGFSLGANQVLKYLGEAPERLPAELAGGVAFSTPADLDGSERVINLPSRRIYREYMMRGLRARIRRKAIQFPGRLDPTMLARARSLRQFDHAYTAPICGFASAEDYYARASALQFLGRINLPTLMITALDDPFLSPTCYPWAEAEANPHLSLETPKYGGHVGFRLPGHAYWSELRAVEFLNSLP